MRRRANCFLVFLVTLFIGTLSGLIPFSEQPTVESAPAGIVPDQDKLEIVKAILREIDPKADHVITRPGNVLYIVREGIPDSVVSHLSKEKFKFEVRTVVTSGMLNEPGSRPDFTYVTFTGWKSNGNNVMVTDTAYFRGGNIGGCNHTFLKTIQRTWRRVKSDCFAMAS